MLLRQCTSYIFSESVSTKRQKPVTSLNGTVNKKDTENCSPVIYWNLIYWCLKTDFLRYFNVHPHGEFRPYIKHSVCVIITKRLMLLLNIIIIRNICLCTLQFFLTLKKIQFIFQVWHHTPLPLYRVHNTPLFIPFYTLNNLWNSQTQLISINCNSSSAKDSTLYNLKKTMYRKCSDGTRIGAGPAFPT